MNTSMKFRVASDSPSSECRIWELEDVSEVIFGTDYLQFISKGKVILSIPHNRVQYFEELS